ncbi:uncharacterized protein MEPE_01453 [Melanopsichium pennsylvanicum]|uniref:Uncharacterized protein n=2 Tax=Melanopsichium pennsylvanicum TaxID=63383 RepID=A0AAJ4XI22_9BASI|nr:conserved hypothetical protein [Melanopsichium pennsylvanicum 4]SNX82747.1 uncharacterized protein MEPE_01453 [Melanopsichium pennsylvanicum]
MSIASSDRAVASDAAGKHAAHSRRAEQAKQALAKFKLIAPPVIGALLLSPFVLEHRLRSWMSPDPFFVYIHFFLFFFPSPLAAGAYLERSVITLVFVSVGAGLAFAAIYGCILIDGAGSPAYSSEKTRAIGVCMLIFFSFTSGTLSSYAPRLKGPCRALLFATIWELTKQYDELSARVFFDNFYPAMVAMIIGIFCNLAIFPRTARRTSIRQLCDLFDGTHRLMEQAVEEFFANRSNSSTVAGSDTSPAADLVTSAPRSSSFKKLKVQLETLQNRLESSLDGARYELSYSRVHIDHLQFFLPIFRDIRAWFSCSLVCLSDSRSAAEPIAWAENSPATASVTTQGETGSDSIAPSLDFEDSIRAISAEVASSLDCMRRCIRKCTDISSSGKLHNLSAVSEKEQEFIESDPHLALILQKQKLRDSIRTFKAALNAAMQGSRSEVVGKPSSEETVVGAAQLNSALESRIDVSELSSPAADQDKALCHLFRNEAYQISFLMVSLLEVALLVDSCLNGALIVAKTWQGNPYPSWRVSAAKWRYWLGRKTLGAGDEMALADERVDALLHEDEPPSPASEARDDTIDFFDDGSHDLLGPNAAHLERIPSRVSNSVASIHAWVRAHLRGVRKLLRTRRALRFRFALSSRVRTLRHSRHIKFGIKLTAGIVLLTLPCWLALGDGKRWWLDQRGQWMAISYLFCLETSTGASIRTSFFRILGTFSGSLLGLIISEISRNNPYALAFLLTLSTIPPSYLVLFTRFQGVGTVMGLTLPIVALLPAESAQESVVYVAWNRGYMIFLGIIAALVVNLFFWPIHARLELVKRVSSITSHLQSLYLSLSRQMLSGGLTSSPKSNAAFEKLEVSIEKRIDQARGLVDIMTIEVSLKPKPTQVLSELLDHLEIILELLMGLRKCREHGLRSMRQHAVVNVLELRQSLIASVLLVLWTTGQALQTQAPLPQCLPSPRLALAELTEAVAEQLREMTDGVEHSHHHKVRGGFPDAYLALDSLNHRSVLANVRRRAKKRHGLHSIQSASPIPRSENGAVTPNRDQPSHGHHSRRTMGVSDADTPATTRKRSLDYAMFFILAEHALLEEIVSSLERLLELCRNMVGEASFLRTEFVPTHEIKTPGEATPASHLGAVEADESEAQVPLGGSQGVAVAPMPSADPRQSVLQRGDSGRSRTVPDISRPRDASPMNRPVHPSPLAHEQLASSS